MLKNGSNMENKNDSDISRKERILLAAERVFAEKGYKGTTVREVARQAGIVNSLIFYYFKNKAVLYEAVFQHTFSQLEVLIQQNLDLELDHLDKLEKIMYSIIDLAVKRRNLLKILFREIFDNGSFVPNFIQDYYKPLYEICDEFFTRGREEGIFRDVDSLHFIHSLMGLLAFYFITDPLLEAVDVEDPYGPQEIEMHKKEVWNIIRSRLV